MEINNEDLLAIQHYVMSGDDHRNLHPDTLLLDLTHSNLVQRHIEIRFDKHTTVSSLRDKIFQKTGTPPQSQHLQLISAGQVFREIPPETESARMLGYYSLERGMTIHCVDIDPNSKSSGGQYEDTSLVKRYVMSDDDYNKRKGTLRDWERQKKASDPSFSLAKHAKEHREMAEAMRQAKLGLELPKGFEYGNDGKPVRIEVDVAGEDKENQKAPESEFTVDTVEGIKVGMRCQVDPGNRRGEVAFVGEVPELGSGGYWAGVVFDEPVGKTDGTTKTGNRYFDAPGSKYGGFIRGKNLEVGDFPEKDIMDELESDSDDEL
jgi:tubulin-folding cofactor B